MSTAPSANLETFSYRAQTLEGQPLSGTIDAENVDLARSRLESLRLRVLEMSPARAAGANGAAPLRGVDFLTFNQQLAHLTSAGMPIERGLRLIAQDMRRGRVSSTIRQIADELDKGVPLAQAFEKHASRFPPAYGRLVESSEDTAKLDAMEKAGKLKRIPFADRAQMKKMVDPVMAEYAKEIGADAIYAKINAIK